MMKKSILFLFAVAILFSCREKKEANMTISGTLNGYTANSLFLYEAANEQYKHIRLLDTIGLNNGAFAYSNDTLQTALYFVSTSGDNFSEKTFEEGTYLFLRKGENNVRLFKNEQNKMEAENNSFELQKSYVDFNNKKREISRSPILDSLDQLFFAARDAENEAEAERIKEESMPYYDQSAAETKKWLSDEIARAPTSLFGLYLFYTYRFQNDVLNTLEEIAQVRERLQRVEPQAVQSAYYKKMEARLALFEKCAVGHEAPEINGVDTLGNEVKLSDFRGKYVLVDFWSSTCTWCRAETPVFRKTYDAFKDKNLIIFGVSSDYSKEEWLKAIHEDKSYWNQILMSRKDMTRIMNSYAIVGIPLIFLVNPEGVILAKDLRGEDIYNAVVEHVK